MYVTDILPQIVPHIYTNIAANVPPEDLPETHLRDGRDCEGIYGPLDLIYANLPLVMVNPKELDRDLATTTLTDESAYEHLSIGPHDNLRRWSMLSQLGFLLSAKEKLKPDGTIITLIGGRIPDSAIEECFQRAGLQHERTLTGFMRQSDSEYLEQYAAWEQREGTNFLFFNYAVANVLLQSARIDSPEILDKSEDSVMTILCGADMSAQKAYEHHLQGGDVGHLAYAFSATPQ